MSREDLARLVLKHRTQAALSQTAMARRCGLSAGTVIKLEQGRAVPDPRTLFQLAPVLGAAPEALLRLCYDLPAPGGHPRRGSLTAELARLIAEVGLHWLDLDGETQSLLAGLLRRVVAIERSRRPVRSAAR